MKKKILNIFTISVISSISFLGCTNIVDDATSDVEPNKTTLTVDNITGEFIINTTVNNLSDYYYAAHSIVDSNSGISLLFKGASYKGTITTTCSSNLVSSTYKDYICISKWNTESPLGDPQDETNTIRIYDSSSYKVILSEYSLYSGNKETEIGSIPQ